MDRYKVTAKPGSRTPSVTLIEGNHYEIAVRERPEKGKATSAVRKALAAHLHVSPSRLSLIMGGTSRVKIFEFR
jgi:uncharacterized protein YggU (UPF0235/DUF167 family)